MTTGKTHVESFCCGGRNLLSIVSKESSPKTGIKCMLLNIWLKQLSSLSYFYFWVNHSPNIPHVPLRNEESNHCHLPYFKFWVANLNHWVVLLKWDYVLKINHVFMYFYDGVIFICKNTEVFWLLKAKFTSIMYVCHISMKKFTIAAMLGSIFKFAQEICSPIFSLYVYGAHAGQHMRRKRYQHFCEEKYSNLEYCSQ